MILYGRRRTHTTSSWSLVAAAFGLALCGAQPDPARQPDHQYRLVFNGSQRCGDRSSFIKAVRRRLPTAYETAEAATQVVVEFEDTGPLSHGKLSIRTPDVRMERELTPGSCS